MEGKTTVVSNLGIALAEIGNKVLLIDGDLRRPRLHKVFDQINSWGLSDVLREKNAIEELPLEVLVKKTAVPRLYLLPSGTSTDNIFGLLCSGRMARLLPRFRQEFDYVLVDAPPCLEFADARIIARYAERLLLVVRADYTDRKTAQAAVQRLLLDGIPVMGVIFNYWDPTHSDLYGYAGYRQELSEHTRIPPAGLARRCAGRNAGRSCAAAARPGVRGCRNGAADARPFPALEFRLGPDRKRGVRRLPVGSDCGAGKVGQFLHDRAILPGAGHRHAGPDVHQSPSPGRAGNRCPPSAAPSGSICDSAPP